MTFSELRKKEGTILGLAALNRLLTAGASSYLKKFLLLGLPILMVAILSYQWAQFFPPHALYGLMLLDIAALLVIFMLDSFYYSHYLSGIRFALPEWALEHHGAVIPFEVLEIISNTSPADFTFGFLNSRTGKDAMVRLNISGEIVDLYAKSDRHKIYADSVTFSDPVDIVSYAAAVFDADPSFANLLTEHGVGRNDFIGAMMWISDVYEREKETFRWWGRDALGRIKGIGKDWTEGETELMKKFGSIAEPKDEESVFKKEISNLERALSRSEGKKVLMVADEYRKLEAILSGFAERISDGSVLPPLQHKKLFILDTAKFDDITQAEGRFQIILGEIFAEAVLAGNIILVIKNFPFLAFAAKKRGMNLSDIIEPFIVSNLIDIVALSTTQAHGELLKPDKNIISHFEHIHIENEDEKIILHSLERKAYEAEMKSDIFFTYQALTTLADIASKTKGEHMTEYRALALLIEIIPKILKKGVKIVTVSDIIAVAR